jgi:hypothetical protein
MTEKFPWSFMIPLPYWLFHTSFVGRAQPNQDTATPVSNDSIISWCMSILYAYPITERLVAQMICSLKPHVFSAPLIWVLKNCGNRSRSSAKCRIW